VQKVINENEGEQNVLPLDLVVRKIFINKIILKLGDLK